MTLPLCWSQAVVAFDAPTLPLVGGGDDVGQTDDVPALLAELERLKAENARLTAAKPPAKARGGRKASADIQARNARAVALFGEGLRHKKICARLRRENPAWDISLDLCRKIVSRARQRA